MIYIEIINGQVTRSTEFEAVGSKYQNCITTDYDDYTPNNNKYIYDSDSNSIVLNPNYETEEQQKAIAQRVAELKEELNQLDLKSIRAIRSGDTEYIERYEAEAEELREQIRELENG